MANKNKNNKNDKKNNSNKNSNQNNNNNNNMENKYLCIIIAKCIKNIHLALFRPKKGVSFWANYFSKYFFKNLPV